ncbi:hypothetical protein PRIPAC_79039 [Pristionchus pacificus]|nr:hypothetical protein PRIPAC_79039 [Pristionchus pacificus]
MDSSKSILRFSIKPINSFCEKEKCTRSVSRNLIKDLKGLVCVFEECNKTFNANNLPVIVYCGHYICVRHKTDDGFTCPVTKCAEEDGTHKKVYLDDLILNGFYKAIEENGFPCMGCNGWHPKHNVVYCPNHKRVDNRDCFLCVWCALSEKYENCEALPIASNIQATRPSEGNRLVSLDRTQEDAGWALNQCCVCWDEPLYQLGQDDQLIGHLNCNHLIHFNCKEQFETGRVRCKICLKLTEKDDVKLRKSHANDFLNSTTTEDLSYELCKNESKNGCRQYHPQSNLKPEVSFIP